MKWDANVERAFTFPNYSGKCYRVNYLKQKKQFGISSRDYVDKSISFYDKGKFYKFSCGVPNSELPGPNGAQPLCPLPDKYTVRGFTNINVSMCHRNPVDGKIMLTAMA